MEASEKEERKGGNIWRNKGWHFLSVMKDINLCIQKLEQTPKRIKLKRDPHQKSIIAKDRENLGNIKRERTRHVQGKH